MGYFLEEYINHALHCLYLQQVDDWVDQFVFPAAASDRTSYLEADPPKRLLLSIPNGELEIAILVSPFVAIMMSFFPE